MTRAGAYLILLITQITCAVFFFFDLTVSVLGLGTVPMSWSMRELMETGALVGLFLGIVFGAVVVTRTFRDLNRAQAQVQRASAAFVDLMNARFSEWDLTLAERDVALFAIKGFTVQDIAKLRQTSEGTVKSQTAAIYRKADVSGRPQLLSLFIEDLLGVERAVPQLQPKTQPHPLHQAQLNKDLIA